MGNNSSSPTSKDGQQHHHSPAHESPRHHRSRDSRTAIPTHHRASVAPPEPSLAQATGSTSGRPKSLPTTAVSSLSGSPHSQASAPLKTAAQPSDNTSVKPSPAGSLAKSPPPAPAPAAAGQMDQPSKPVDVPLESSSLRSHQSTHPSHEPAPQLDNLLSQNSLTDMSYLTRPPRLPLPIEEEVHTPGSPIVAPEQGPTEEPSEIDLGEAAEAMTRKSSGLSAGTVEDDDEELRVDRTRSVVPTRLEWKRGGDKVYVTGTIFQWNRKQRLHPVEGKPGCLAATIHILPGTHHVRFLVDGVMQTSPDLPTTVDFGNNLVNFIEVNPDDLRAQSTSQTVIQPTSSQPTSRTPSQTQRASKGKSVQKVTYTSHIPQYLLDFDQAEDSPVYQSAVAAIEKLPNPPSLPGFLGKPILNAAVVKKDDNSVLVMPNHTVLNHLATSSIKNGTLAVSATTRYRNKCVTTIIYKPSTTSEEG